VSSSDSDRVERARQALEAAGQEHVLRFADELAPEQLTQLLDQVEALDLSTVSRCIDDVLGESVSAPCEVLPPEVIEVADDDASRAREAEARAAGEERLAAGKVGAFLVAGGQGTRLGYDGPKGRYPVGPLTRRSLFAYHAHRVLATCRRYHRTLPFYVMTSPANNASTVSAFEEAGWFGLDPEQVMFLVQGTLPAVDRSGRMLLAEKHSLSLSPDGHGGCFTALDKSGALEDMACRGVEDLFYFQVDNPLAQVFDPVFLGHHALGRSQMSTKVVEKSDPAEKVGVLARADGRNTLVEYSDLEALGKTLGQDLMGAREPNGKLRFRAGNIAIHVLDLAFVRELISTGGGLPVHRAHKKVPHIDASGARVQPTEPNAVKMELFVFDALLAAERVVTQVVRREDEFAPVKNAEGADSPATAHAALVSQGKRWLEAAGLALPEGDVEVGPLFALDREAFTATLTRADFGPVFDRA
jgi:UDP-N-acetylglucosamine/UDP-N-acetylgalactosamine diphosphorylase